MRSAGKRMAGLSLKALAVAGAAMLFIAPANANLVVTTAGGGGGDNAQSVPGCTGLSGGPATTIAGCLSSNNSTDVIFKGTENLDFAGSGQSSVSATDPLANEEAKDVGFNNLTISLGSGLVFSSLVLKVEQFKPDTNLTFFANFGSPVTITPDASEMFTLTSDAGQLFDWIRVESLDRTFTVSVGKGKNKSNVSITDGNINDVKDVRFSGVQTPPCSENCGAGGTKVPEPSTMALLGAGLLGFGFFGRRRQRARQSV